MLGAKLRPAAVRRATRPLATFVEASGKHVPWGGLGSGTYTAATKGCFDVIARTQPLVQKALGLALEARRAAGTANVTPFAIADFGTADGGTSIPLMRSVVQAVRAAEPDAPIVVNYEDQAANDWQSLFKLVHGDMPNGPQTYMDGSVDNVYVLATGASFYEACFAPGSVDFSFCATAMHWLTAVPCQIPDAIHSACSTHPATLASFATQAAKDWEHILLRRAAELKSGGQFVVANFAIDEEGQFLGRSVDGRVKQSMHHNFSELWQQVAGDEVHANTNFCNEYRSLEACTAPFRDGGSAVSKSGLQMVSAETDLVQCPFHNEWVGGLVTDPKVQAANFVPTTRTWSNSTFAAGAMASGKSAAEAAAMTDELFSKYEAKVALAPEEHAMDYVHSYVHAAKQ
jgi:indole-3-acetate O-methyltransferase